MRAPRPPVMTKGRMEAFSDGVLAIIITIMVLELKVPHGPELDALRPLVPVFLSYVLSFLYVGIYWNNHHHLMAVAGRIGAGTMWANLHLLFWLSLIPFVTGWMGENHFATLPTALYGVVLLAAAIAYRIMQGRIVGSHDHGDPLRAAFGADIKGKASIALYLVGIGVSFLHPWAGCAIYMAVAILWIIPDRRVERTLTAASNP